MLSAADIDPRVGDALAVIYDLDRPRLASVDYMTAYGIDINRVARHCGCPTVLPIMLLPNRRFDMPDGHGAESTEGCVIEARAEDGETVIDLVAWPISNPRNVRSLIGAVSILGLSQAFNASTYVFGYPLVVHRTPLAWLQADCHGAAVVIPDFAARTFLEIADFGGRIGAEDFDHARELRRHLDAMTKCVEIVAPKSIRRVA